MLVARKQQRSLTCWRCVGPTCRYYPESSLTKFLQKLFFSLQEWSTVAEVSKTTHTVSDLQADTEYVFRVKAVDSSVDLPSEWSDNSVVVRTEIDGKKPEFKKVLPKQQDLHETKNMTLTAEFSATPAPVVKWLCNGSEITSQNMANAVVSTTTTKSTLTVKTGNMENEGVYS